MESALRTGAASGVRLIETMLWDGAEFPRLALHMARLAAGTGALGYVCDMPGVQAALAQAVTAARGPLRVRLTCGAAGDADVTTAPLPAPAAEWRIGLAATRLRSGDPWLGVKSTRRAGYDAARATLPDGLDEVIFLNERGEVCDGTITTVFYDRGYGLRTPPLRCGLLPGVLRAALAPPEETLLPADLPHVRLWVGNALRGMIAARWIG